nr:hypothetical protein [Tanacetum cinerariifolium]
FKSSLGLVMVLLGRVPEPEVEASQLVVEESKLDEPELDGYGIDGFWLGFRALTGATTGSATGATTGSEFGTRVSTWTTGVTVLLGRVLEPKDEASQLAVEESRVDEPELGNPGLDKLEAGLEHD